MMKYKKEIISKIKLENIEKFIQNNEIIYLKKYIFGICGAPHAIGNIQVKV